MVRDLGLYQDSYPLRTSSFTVSLVRSYGQGTWAEAWVP
jgi:hypothetical protein